MTSLLFPLLVAIAAEPESRTYDTPRWSEAVAGIQAKVTLVQKEKYNGTRMLVPYLELKNAGDSAHPVKVPLSSGNVKFELVDKEGKVVRDGWTLPRSGPHVDPGVVTLPLDSEMKIGMYCSNWGVPKDAAAQISTDSGSWILKEEERQKVYLRATLKSDLKEPHPDFYWKGTLVTPLIRVDWQ